MSPRIDRYGDPIEDDAASDAPLSRQPRKGRARKGRPIGGLRANIEAVDGKCPKCDRLVCACHCRVCGGNLKPGWLVHPSCREAA